MDIKDKMSMMDDIYSRYLMNKNEREFCRDLEQFLRFLTRNKNINVTIVDNKIAKDPFFGMRIFPAADEIDAICQDLLNDKLCPFNQIMDRWKHISTWELEIDSRAFDRNMITFNPEELTAMTLHEVGHVIYSDTKVEQFYRAYRSCKVQMKYATSVGARIMYFMYQIPLLFACGMKDWTITSKHLKEEMYADCSVEKLGYGEALISAYSKIIKECGNTVGAYDEHKTQAELERMITWCNLNVSDLDHRKNKLKDELYFTGSKTSSNYIKNTIRDIMKKLGIATKHRYSGNIVMESSIIAFENTDTFLDEYALMYDLKAHGQISNALRSTMESANLELAQEAFGRNKKKSIDVPSQLDVDTIYVEVDRMANHADRRYVLDLIYNQEEKIERFKELYAYNSGLEAKYGEKMESMLKDLAAMRKAVLAKRSFDKQYRVFVKYPEGYEG